MGSDAVLPAPISGNNDALILALQQPGYPETVVPEDLDRIFERILPVMRRNIDIKIASILKVISPESTDSLPWRATSLKAENTLKYALSTYLFKNKKWKQRVPLIPYLLATLHNFTAGEINAHTLIPRMNKFVCPACKEYNLKEPLLEMSERRLHCDACKQFLSSCDSRTIFEKRWRLATLFLNHSKKGVTCPRCKRFVPQSLMTEDGKLFCPYDLCGVDCGEAEKCNHPIGLFPVDVASLEYESSSGAAKYPGKKIEAQKGIFAGALKDKKLKSVDVSLEQLEIARKAAASIKQIVVNQKSVNRSPCGAPNKSAMYDAIYSMTEKHPFEMVNFLARKERLGELPMQALIYQEFSKNMLTNLPITIHYSNSEPFVIEDPLDDRLRLFSSICAFTAPVDKGLVVRKPTVLLKNKSKIEVPHGVLPKVAHSFMGYLRRVMDENCNDITDEVNMYSFVNLRLKQSSSHLVGQKVYVEYFSIPAHYSMQSMAHLRRIVKRLHQSCIARKI